MAAKFERNIKTGTSIPTASMGDIVFMLLLFFMVTTVFKTEDGLPVDLPRAESGVEPKRELVTHVWIDRKGRKRGVIPRSSHAITTFLAIWLIHRPCGQKVASARITRRVA